MPKYIVTSPDGKNFEVTAPEGATQDQVLAYAKENFSQPTQEQVDATSGFSRFVRGVSDPVTGLAQLAYNSLPESVQNLGTDIDKFLFEKTGGVLGAQTDFNTKVEQDEARYQQARQAVGQTGVDAYRAAGNVASTLPLGLAAPGLTTATMPARMAGGAAIGGGISATMPVTENTENFASEKGKQIATGAVFGAAAAPVAEGVARIVKPLTDQAVNRLSKQGINLTPGSVLGGTFKTAEDKFRSIPITGDMISSGQVGAIRDFNRAAYNRALEPIGKSADKLPIGRAGVEAVKRELSNAYEELLPKVKFASDPEFAADIQKIRTMVYEGLSEPAAKRFDNILRNKFVSRMTDSGLMTGRQLKAVESELGKMAKNMRKSQDYDVSQIGDAIGELQSSIRNALMRSNPQHAERLKAINSGYANYAVIRKAASMANTEDMFSPAQLAAAVRQSDKSVGKGAVATGNARMQDLADDAVRVMGSRVPDSGTAGRLMMAGVTGGAAFAEPTILGGLAAAGLPFTSAGKRTLMAILSKRPEGAGVVANAVRGSSPVLGVGAGTALSE